MSEWKIITRSEFKAIMGAVERVVRFHCLAPNSESVNLEDGFMRFFDTLPEAPLKYDREFECDEDGYFHFFDAPSESVEKKQKVPRFNKFKDGLRVLNEAMIINYNERHEVHGAFKCIEEHEAELRSRIVYLETRLDIIEKFREAETEK